MVYEQTKKPDLQSIRLTNDTAKGRSNPGLQSITLENTDRLVHGQKVLNSTILTQIGAHTSSAQYLSQLGLRLYTRSSSRSNGFRYLSLLEAQQHDFP